MSSIPNKTGGAGSRLQRFFPWIIAALALAYIVSVVARPDEGGPFDWSTAGRIPVLADGRVKPLDTFARNSLMVISGRQTFMAGEERAPAIAWFFEVMADPDIAATREVFRIDHPDVVALLGLENSGRTRFSYKEIDAHVNEIDKQADLAQAVAPKKRDPFQRQVLALENSLGVYYQISRAELPFSVAPLETGDEWRPLSVVLQDAKARSHLSAQAIMGILIAYAEHKAPEFNRDVDDYLKTVSTRLGSESAKAGYETVFNRIEPFYQAAALYVLAFLLASVQLLMGALAKPGWGKALGRATLGVIAIAFVVHTVGIVSRIYLQGRPPVTNLYSSAVFIGWACIVLAMASEWFFRLGLGSLAASLIGFGTLVVAHNLAGGGDTMEMMQAVLDTNFWLATHVVMVTIGYSATFLAGFLGAGYLVLGALTPLLKGDPLKALPKMTYGVICFAALASFVGTVLGGIWADQSWGRFWGWDPKENGAALIVLMNLLTLHARWGGMVKERGVAVLAVLGNIVTAWSWFGTNMLGVGLHSYGFMESAVFWLAGFCVLQLVIMCVGFVPTERWRSLGAASKTRKKSRKSAEPPEGAVPAK